MYHHYLNWVGNILYDNLSQIDSSGSFSELWRYEATSQLHGGSDARDEHVSLNDSYIFVVFKFPVLYKSLV